MGFIMAKLVHLSCDSQSPVSSYDYIKPRVIENKHISCKFSISALISAATNSGTDPNPFSSASSAQSILSQNIKVRSP